MEEFCSSWNVYAYSISKSCVISEMVRDSLFYVIMTFSAVVSEESCLVVS